ncbi:hypothetical protein DMC61_25180 [Amycolatopsis sp. WAC 04169]|uniref:LysR family transcriptional regulator n=1 Tax=Amycolatopsis sp. WAC 04169 TaxID=2203197 RepID=UPI000F7B5F06|nr:LysR family transcriptional regulator [Amycolatopsis sp. WAC 04169]RSN26766.1 hypothetical protein DMC61_25180 [Amycolatopsis sp. WAC 04169]
MNPIDYERVRELVGISGKVTLRQLDYFVAAAVAGSAAGAAAMLHVTPSAVSQQLGNLEASIGLPLIGRTGKKLTLTPAGEILLRRASMCLRYAKQAVIEAGGQGDRKPLRLGTLLSIATDVIPGMVDFSKAPPVVPAVHVTAYRNPVTLLQSLKAGESDIVIGPLSKLDCGPHFVCLGVEEFVVLYPRSFNLPKNGTLRSLSGYPWVGYCPENHAIGELLDRECLKGDGVELRYETYAPEVSAAVNMVKAGAGLALVPYCSALQAGEQVGWLHLDGCVTRTMDISSLKLSLRGGEAWKYLIHSFGHNGAKMPLRPVDCGGR